MLFQHENPVILEPIKHQYFDTDYNEYISWSKFFKQYEDEFDSNTISWYMSGRNRKKQSTILQEWDDTRENSIIRGNYIHDNMDSYQNTGEVLDSTDFQVTSLAKSIGKLFSGYRYRHFEQAVWSEEDKVAGTADVILGEGRESKMKKGDQWIDIFDYKTNISKGIRHKSQYYQSYKYPIAHLTACEYNKYCLQLSGYAYMAEKTWGYKIGRLGIIYIPENMMNWHVIPVPYMRSEIEFLFHNFAQTKKADAIIIPSKKGSKNSPTSGSDQDYEKPPQSFV